MEPEIVLQHIRYKYENSKSKLFIYLSMLCYKIIYPGLIFLSPLTLLLKIFIQKAIKPSLCYTADQLNVLGTLTVPAEPLAKSIAKYEENLKSH